MSTEELLAPGLLRERTVALAGGGRPAVAATLSGLGARVVPHGDGADAGARAAARAPVHALVYDAAAAFAGGGATGLRAALDDGWSAIHAVATGAFIPARSGTIVLLAPHAGAGAGVHAPAVRGALENLARTLSVEWARFGITATSIAPGPCTSDAEIATLVAFLISPAGGYFSGCRFELGAIG